MNVLKLLTLMRKAKLDIGKVQFILAVDKVGGSGSAFQIAKAMELDNPEQGSRVLPTSRMMKYGIIEFDSMKDGCKNYKLTSFGRGLLKEVKQIIETANA